MPSLKETKRRIISVKNTQKITKAMKLVSSAKYARANQAVFKSAPYYKDLSVMVRRVLVSCQEHEGKGWLPKAFLPGGEEKKSLLIILTPDRGLCGGLNSNILKKAGLFLDTKLKAQVSCELMLWGKRAISFGKKGVLPILEQTEKVLHRPNFALALEKAKVCLDLFLSGKVDRVYVCYSRFETALVQTPIVEQLLPINVEEALKGEDDFLKRVAKKLDEKARLEEEKREFLEKNTSFRYDAAPGLLLEKLSESIVNAKLFHIFLSAVTAEHGARMAAMDSATTNADKVIKDLTLCFNRQRQAMITKELIEITSGASVAGG